MGALEKFRRRIRRLRYRFKAWRFRRRELHENRIIANQQKQIEALHSAWEEEVSRKDRHLAQVREDFDKERRELTLQIELATDNIEQLEEIICRDRARVKAEMSHHVRLAEENENKPGLIK